MSIRVVGLTTKDNPFSPFNEFREWLNFDVQHNYGTLNYFARVCRITNDMTDEENAKEIERAIDQIIKNDIFDMYKKVVEIENDNKNDLIAS